MPLLSEAISGLLADDVLLFSALLSQFISNVPTAVLLSHFTGDWAPLLVGVNIGGAGTLVGSLASLITLRYFTTVRKMFPQLRDMRELSTGHFLKMFCLLNLGFLVALLVICACTLPYPSLWCFS